MVAAHNDDLVAAGAVGSMTASSRGRPSRAWPDDRPASRRCLRRRRDGLRRSRPRVGLSTTPPHRSARARVEFRWKSVHWRGRHGKHLNTRCADDSCARRRAVGAGERARRRRSRRHDRRGQRTSRRRRRRSRARSTPTAHRPTYSFQSGRPASTGADRGDAAGGRAPRRQAVAAGVAASPDHDVPLPARRHEPQAASDRQGPHVQDQAAAARRVARGDAEPDPRPAARRRWPGVLSGTGNGNRQVLLQSNPWPYTQGFLNRGTRQVTDRDRRRSRSRCSPCRSTRSTACSWPRKPDVASPIVVARHHHKITRHAKVRRGSKRGRIHFWGTSGPPPTARPSSSRAARRRLGQRRPDARPAHEQGLLALHQADPPEARWALPGGGDRCLRRPFAEREQVRQAASPALLTQMKASGSSPIASKACSSPGATYTTSPGASSCVSASSVTRARPRWITTL